MRTLQENIISSNKYAVRFAADSEDIKKAQRLRFNVFNLELGEGLASSYEHNRDIDDFDTQCHHLLVILKSTGEVIGTYRMQTYDMARRGHGFYTAGEYDLSNIPDDILDESVEVGRACIDDEHRNGRVLFFLWRGLATYLKHFKKRYLFGCCSLTSQSPVEAWTVMQFLKKKGYLNEQCMVEPTKRFLCKKTNPDEELLDKISLPQLFRLYMDLGAKVCSPPAIDEEFKTIDYLVLLDIESLDERSRLLFFK